MQHSVIALGKDYQIEIAALRIIKAIPNALTVGNDPRFDYGMADMRFAPPTRLIPTPARHASGSARNPHPDQQ